MSVKPTYALLAALVATPAAAAEYRFDFSGTIASGSAVGGPSLAGTAFTFSLFVMDTTDLTPGSAAANYRLARATLDIGSDGGIEESSLSPDPFAAVYIDPGATQLIGGFDLFNPGISFLIGVHVPSAAFADPKDLSTQSAFALSGLTPATLNYYNSAQYGLVFDVTGFGFNNGVAVVPLPAPVAMGAVGLLCAGVAARRLASK
jgi:hypothetical protein